MKMFAFLHETQTSGVASKNKSASIKMMERGKYGRKRGTVDESKQCSSCVKHGGHSVEAATGTETLVFMIYHVLHLFYFEGKIFHTLTQILKLSTLTSPFVCTVFYRPINTST